MLRLAKPIYKCLNTNQEHTFDLPWTSFGCYCLITTNSVILRIIRAYILTRYNMYSTSTLPIFIWHSESSFDKTKFVIYRPNCHTKSISVFYLAFLLQGRKSFISFISVGLLDRSTAVTAGWRTSSSKQLCWRRQVSAWN